MPRTRHSRTRDHFGTDLDTNIVLDGDLASPAATVSGTTLHQALTDINASITGSGDANYVHDQGSAASTWTVVHNLGKFPSVSVVDSANTVVQGAIDYIDINSLTLTFSAPFGGRAFCN